MVKPRLSLVVPVSRGPEFVEPLIRSLEAQDSPEPFELILVSDAPASYSSSKVAVRSIVSPSRHPCVKRNVGAAAAAAAEFLGFVDDDAALDPGWVGSAVKALEAGADVVTGPSDRPYSQDEAQKIANFIVCSPVYSLKSALANHQPADVRFYEVALCNVAMRRKVWAEVGGFNEVSWYWVDDAEFFHRAETRGFRLRNDPGVSAAHWKRPVLWPLARHYFRQRWHAGLSAWVFPELYWRQKGVWLAALLLAAFAASGALAPWLGLVGFAAVALGGAAAYGTAWAGFCMAAATSATVLGFWAGLVCGLPFRFLSRADLAYKRYRAGRVDGKEIVSPPLALLRQAVPYRLWGPRAFPQWLIYFVTARCNARCPMCFYLPEIGEADRARELTAEEARRVVASLPPITYLSLSGGEPYLREDLVEIVQAFIDSARPAFVSIPTNGSFPERVERTIEQLSRRNPGTAFDVHLSLDGPREVHDAIRGEKAAPFEKVMETHRRVLPLFRRRDNVGIKFVVTCSSLNLESLEPFLERLIDENECDRVNLVPLHGNVQDKAMAVENERYVALARRMYDRAERKGYARFRDRLFYAIKRAMDARLGPMLAEGDLGRVCGAGQKIAVLGPYGDVLPCEPLRRSVGNVRDFGYDLPKVLAGPEMSAFAQRFLGPGKCHCNWGCAIGNALVHDPGFYPAVARELAKGLF